MPTFDEVIRIMGELHKISDGTCGCMLLYDELGNHKLIYGTCSIKCATLHECKVFIENKANDVDTV
jgi:hypothetical protein